MLVAENLNDFLEELTALTRKYKIKIDHDIEDCALRPLGHRIDTEEYRYYYINACLYWGCAERLKDDS